MSKKHVFCFSAVLLSLVSALPAYGAEGAANELPPVVRTLKDIEQGRKNVESVLRSLSEMFSTDAVFPAMSIKRPKLQPAYHRIIKGENNRSVLIFRPRFSKAERLYKALDGVVVGARAARPPTRTATACSWRRTAAYRREAWRSSPTGRNATRSRSGSSPTWTGCS